MPIATRVFLSLGSNLGNRTQYLSTALTQLEIHEIRVIRKSVIYESEPWGVRNQEAFLNQVVEIETQLDPDALLHTLKSVETVLGRKERARWHEREIDIDILYYNDKIINRSHLHIPHLHVRERRFVLIPLCEIAPQFIDPQTGQTIAHILATTSDNSEVTPL